MRSQLIAALARSGALEHIAAALLRYGGGLAHSDGCPSQPHGPRPSTSPLPADTRAGGSSAAPAADTAAQCDQGPATDSVTPRSTQATAAAATVPGLAAGTTGLQAPGDRRGSSRRKAVRVDGRTDGNCSGGGNSSSGGGSSSGGRKSVNDPNADAEQPEGPPGKLQKLQQEAVWSLLQSVRTLATTPYTPWVLASASPHRFQLREAVGESADGDELVSAAAERMASFRRLVCGPAVQMLVALCVHNNMRALQKQQPQQPLHSLGIEGQGVTAAGCGMANMRDTLLTAALVFQATVTAGPRRHALLVAQPPPGYVNPPYHAPGAPSPPAIGGPLDHLSPYTGVVNVYDVISLACSSMLMRVSCSSCSSGSIQPLRLLVRLLPELRPRQATVRLPGLWRLLAAAMPLMLDMKSDDELRLDFAGLMCDASLLLRLLVSPPPAPQELQQQSQRPAAGPASASASASGSSSGDTGVVSAINGIASRGSTGAACSYSLRCALDAGLLPALERLLRQAYAAVLPQQGAAAVATPAPPPASGPAPAPPASPSGPSPPAAGELKAATLRVAAALCATGSLLLASGAFPAMLAHGSSTELVSLLKTMGCVLRQLTQHDIVLPDAPTFGECLPSHCSLPLSASRYWACILLSLSEEASALMSVIRSIQQLPVPQRMRLEQQPSSNSTAVPYARGGAHLDGGVPDEADAGAGAAALTANRCMLPVRIGMGWLAVVGGAPPPGSAAAAQQCCLHGLMPSLWMPWLLPSQPDFAGVMVGPDSSGELEHCYELLTMVRRGLRSYLAAVLRHDRAATAATDAAAAAHNDTGSSGSGICSGERALPLGPEGVHAGVTAALSMAAAAATAARHCWQYETLDGYGYYQRCLPLYVESFNLLQHAATLSTDTAGMNPAANSQNLRESDEVPADLAAAAASAQHPSACPAPTATGGAAAGGLGSSGAELLQLVHVAAAALLDVMELDMVCSAEAGMKIVLRLPLRMITFLSRWGLQCRPWLQPFILVSPDEGTGFRGGLDVAQGLPPPDAAANQQAVAGGYAALRREVCARHVQQPGERPLCDGEAIDLLVPAARIEGLLRAEAAQLAAAGGSINSSDTADQDDRKAGGSGNTANILGVPAPRLCGNRACQNLRGGSALIAPGAGKTCARCRGVSYCCGTCQLQHWKEGGHQHVCPLLQKLLPA
ncbi:hypothetical protein HYH02_005727 [Chlamydomonas schloesseri]|uniref:phytol kinase n=1 Tax=Chlamydomonas schloesseri TaxID=2026947 RepID=A0A836B6M0_9CHLO|nr:hypothetical protein HYH02_005727 [Chlamydomonas schloesseri]|eukprot:KAG2448973.1 hypothetical protein HYH02_005727 [Chlamydomonas schloesseri]